MGDLTLTAAVDHCQVGFGTSPGRPTYPACYAPNMRVAGGVGTAKKDAAPLLLYVIICSK